MENKNLKLPAWVDNYNGLHERLTNIAKQLITLKHRKESSERGYRKTCEAMTHVNALIDCLQDIRKTLPVELCADLQTLDGKGLANREEMTERLNKKQRDWFTLGMQYDPAMIVLLGIQQKLHELKISNSAYNTSQQKQGQPAKHAIAYSVIDIEDLLTKYAAPKERISEAIESVFAYVEIKVPSDKSIKKYRKIDEEDRITRRKRLDGICHHKE